MKESEREFDHADLCGLYVAISRLQRFTEQRERRGIDCTAVRELITTLCEQAASMSRHSKRQALKIVALLSQIPLIPDAATLIIGT